MLGPSLCLALVKKKKDYNNIDSHNTAATFSRQVKKRRCYKAKAVGRARRFAADERKNEKESLKVNEREARFFLDNVPLKVKTFVPLITKIHAMR